MTTSPAVNQTVRLLRALGVSHRATVREILVLAVAHHLPPLSIDDIAAVLAEWPDNTAERKR